MIISWRVCVCSASFFVPRRQCCVRRTTRAHANILNFNFEFWVWRTFLLSSAAALQTPEECIASQTTNEEWYLLRLPFFILPLFSAHIFRWQKVLIFLSCECEMVRRPPVDCYVWAFACVCVFIAFHMNLWQFVQNVHRVRNYKFYFFLMMRCVAPAKRWEIIYLCIHAKRRMVANRWMRVCVCAFAAIGLKLIRIRKKFSMNAKIYI